MSRIWSAESLGIRIAFLLTPNPGESIPAVTTKLERTKLDIRNGRKTGSPVSNKMSLRLHDTSPLPTNLGVESNRQSSSPSRAPHSSPPPCPPCIQQSKTSHAPSRPSSPVMFCLPVSLAPWKSNPTCETEVYRPPFVIEKQQNNSSSPGI